MRTSFAVSAFLILGTVACGDLTSIPELSRRPDASPPRPTLHLAPPSAPALLSRGTGRGRARIVLTTSRVGGRDVTLPDRESEVQLVSDSGRVYAVLAETGTPSASAPTPGASLGRLSPNASSAQLQYLGTSGGSILVQISDADGVAVYPTTDGSFTELVNGVLVTHRVTAASLTATAPSWQIRQFTNGSLTSSADYLWTRIVGGWRLDRIRVRSYSTTGTLISDAVLKVATMTMMVGAPRPASGSGAALASAFGQSWGRACDIAGSLLLPAPLQAQSGCSTQLRHQLIAIVGLVLTAATGNPFTFFASAAHAAGATYDWAACMEKNRKR